MIKINLLAEGRRPVAAGPSRWSALTTPGEGATQWIFLGLVLAGVLVMLGNFLLLRSRVESKRADVATAQREVDELAPIIKEVEEFKAKKAELENKVRIIENLKTNQKGPVQIMDQISKALPELLWLNKMEVKTTQITLSGEAFNTNAVANFIENLDKVPEFQEPILKDTSQRGQVYTFVIDFTFVNTAAATGGATTPATAGG